MIIAVQFVPSGEGRVPWIDFLDLDKPLPDTLQLSIQQALENPQGEGYFHGSEQTVTSLSSAEPTPAAPVFVSGYVTVFYMSDT